MQERLDANVQVTIAPISGALGGLIAWVAFTERDLIGVPRLQAIFWADLVVAAFYIGLCLLLWRRPAPVRFAQMLAFLIALAAIATSLTTLIAQRDASPPFTLALVILGAGLVFLSQRWMIALTITVWVAWLLATPLLASSIRTDSLFILQVATAIALVAHWGRLHAYRRFITAEKLEAAGRQKAERLAMELEQFASVVAHDLQNPLTAIRLKCATLRLQAPVTIQSTIDALDHVADNMGHMISDLLDYARAGSRTFLREAVPLASVFHEIEVIFQERFEAAGARLESEGLPTVYGDPTQLTQLFQNLIGNALHYRHPTRPLRVFVHGASVPDGVVVTVADNGQGFDPSIRERMFMPFQRGDTTHTGHGLGLATCRRIMESMNGTIEAASQPSGGALFTLWFPAVTNTTSN